MTAARRGGKQALPAPPSQAPSPLPRASQSGSANPWRALWAMLVGFFMILLDSTIVAVANPSIMTALDTDYDAVIWVTSAYLLAYAVPLLVAGRLGDRFGPKNLYLAGLAIFTVASLACGLAGSIEMLVAARVVQGLGAALLTPQTLSLITRIFPAERRGVAMSLWGATAGVATLVGPLTGGILVDGLGWQWIFIVNVPIGIIGLALAYWLVPTLPTQSHRFDLLGVALSGIGMFLIVFALQEGQTHDWALWVWAMVVAGIGFMAGFVYWQSINKVEPLIPLSVFRDRNFSLSNVGVAVIGFVVTAMVLPAMFYAQAVCGLSPTRAALLTAPMALASGGLAPIVGKIVDRTHPRPIVGFGFSVVAVALTWLSFEMTPTTPIWRLVLPFTVMGIGMAFIWAPLAATATRNLPPALAGAGSGVYNATRQVGSVLGSAGMAAFMTSRISAELPGVGNEGGAEQQVLQLPVALHAPFSTAMSQALLLPAFVALFGVVAAMFLTSGKVSAGAQVTGVGKAPRPMEDAPTDVLAPVVDPDSAYRRPQAVAAGGRGGEAGDYSDEFDDYDDYEEGDYVDDDDYVEYTVGHDEPLAPVAVAVVHDGITHDSVVAQDFPADEDVTEPIQVSVSRYEEPEYDEPVDDVSWQPEPPRVDERSHADWQVPDPQPVDEWDSFLDNLKNDLRSMSDEPIGHGRNGFHVDRDEHPLTPLRDPLGADEQVPFYDSGSVNGSSNGHVNGSHGRHGADFLDRLGFARGNGYFADINSAEVDPAPSDAAPRRHRADDQSGDEPPSRHSRHEQADHEVGDFGAASGAHSGGASHQESGTWRFVDGTWTYDDPSTHDTGSATGRHSSQSGQSWSDPEESGGRHSQ